MVAFNSRVAKSDFNELQTLGDDLKNIKTEKSGCLYEQVKQGHETIFDTTQNWDVNSFTDNINQGRSIYNNATLSTSDTANLFAILDEDHDGILSSEEMQEVFDSKSGSITANKLIQKLNVFADYYNEDTVKKVRNKQKEESGTFKNIPSAVAFMDKLMVGNLHSYDEVINSLKSTGKYSDEDIEFLQNAVKFANFSEDNWDVYSQFSSMGMDSDEIYNYMENTNIIAKESGRSSSAGNSVLSTVLDKKDKEVAEFSEEFASKNNKRLIEDLQANYNGISGKKDIQLYAQKLVSAAKSGSKNFKILENECKAVNVNSEGGKIFLDEISAKADSKTLKKLGLQ